jgi:hypothetical protein
LQYWIYLINYVSAETLTTGPMIYRARRTRYEFYWPDIFRIRTIVHCVMNLSWFCNQISYLMFSILGQWIYHDFESIQPCISSFSFPWDMEFVMVLSPYFTSKGVIKNSNWRQTSHWETWSHDAIPRAEWISQLL